MRNPISHTFFAALVAFMIGATLLSPRTSGDEIQSTQSALLLIGGGQRPVDGLRLWSEGSTGKIVLIPWASEIQEETLQALRSDFLRAGVEADRLVFAPLYQPGLTDFPARALPILREAKALFFSGGDQNRLMQALGAITGLSDEVVQRFHAGNLAIAGTSAGTAIATALRFTGNEDLGRIDPAQFEGLPGLDLLQNAIVDQHFIRRSRLNRLISAVLKHPERTGFGIDEDTALWIPARSRRAKVLGVGSGVIRLKANGPAPVTTWNSELYPVGTEFEMNR